MGLGIPLIMSFPTAWAFSFYYRMSQATDFMARTVYRCFKPPLSEDTISDEVYCPGRFFTVSSMISSPVTTPLSIRRYLSCLCYASTDLLSGLHGVSWEDALMHFRERCMTLFSPDITMGHLSSCNFAFRRGDIGVRPSPFPKSCLFPRIWGEVPILQSPSSARCQLYHMIRTRLWRECQRAHAYGGRHPSTIKSSPSCCSWLCRHLCLESCLLSPPREVPKCASPEGGCPEERLLSRQHLGHWQHSGLWLLDHKWLHDYVSSSVSATIQPNDPKRPISDTSSQSVSETASSAHSSNAKSRHRSTIRRYDRECRARMNMTLHAIVRSSNPSNIHREQFYIPLPMEDTAGFVPPKGKLLGGSSVCVMNAKHPTSKPTSSSLLPLDPEEDWWPMYMNLASKLQTRSPQTQFLRDVLDHDRFQDLPTDHWKYEFKAMGIDFT